MIQSKWDVRFMERAKQIAEWSKDPEHKVGAVIVDKYNRQIGEGFNGPPIFVKDKDLPREIEVLRTLHAELNAILNSNKSLNDCTIYIYPFAPCAQCAAALIQKSINEVVFYKDSDLASWKASQKEALKMFTEAGINYWCFNRGLG